MKIKLVLFLVLLSVSAKAQDLDSLINISAFTDESDLQKQLNKSTKVASSTGLSTRETPGILSVITAEEIKNLGARDLIDILRMVPGFDIAQDLNFIQGVGLRGNWANEGKVLFRVDGQVYNELLYQTTPLGNHFPVDMIERIEIIRGPGSAIYGGSAEFGVINIITKAAESLNGVGVATGFGFNSDAVARTNGGIMVAQKNKSTSWDFAAFKGKALISNLPYQDIANNYPIQNLKSAASSSPLNLNLGVRAKGFSLRTIYDDYQTGDPFTFVTYKNFYSDLQYDWKVKPSLTITPQVKYYYQIPWAYGDKASGEQISKISAARTSAGLNGNYDLSRKVNINFGALYFVDQAVDLLRTQHFIGNSDSFRMHNFAWYAQSLIRHRLANVTLGFRYEKNNRYGSAFVPRFAITRKIENLHFKFLFSQAFRAPSIENVNSAKNSSAQNGKIYPEKSNVLEAEIGYQFTPSMLLAVNAFNLQTNKIIVYEPLANPDNPNDQLDFYRNYSKSGTKGIEVIYSVRQKNWNVNLTYSYSTPLRSNTVTAYVVPQTKASYLGILNQKLTMSASFNAGQHVVLSPSFVYGAKRYGVTSLDDGANPIVSSINPYLLANLFLNYKNCLVQGLDFGVGVYDLLNQHPVVPQPYLSQFSSFSPIPGRSRELVVKLAYQINFK